MQDVLKSREEALAPFRAGRAGWLLDEDGGAESREQCERRGAGKGPSKAEIVSDKATNCRTQRTTQRGPSLHEAHRHAQTGGGGQRSDQGERGRVRTTTNATGKSGK